MVRIEGALAVAKGTLIVGSYVPALLSSGTGLGIVFTGLHGPGNPAAPLHPVEPKPQHKTPQRMPPSEFPLHPGLPTYTHVIFTTSPPPPSPPKTLNPNFYTL